MILVFSSLKKQVWGSYRASVTNLWGCGWVLVQAAQQEVHSEQVSKASYEFAATASAPPLMIRHWVLIEALVPGAKKDGDCSSNFSR